MKHFIFTLCTIFVFLFSVSNNANAQWQPAKFYEADELKGEDAYFSNHYVGDSGHLICWSNETDVKIITDRGIFDYDDNYVKVVVGFYEGDKLVEKVTTKFFVPDGDSDTAYTSSYNEPKNLGWKIMQHLKTKGKVRIIAPKFSGADFDLTIPMNKDMKIDTYSITVPKL